MKSPVVKSVQILNYRSIQRADLKLTPLTLLVGRNGAGKSNLLDALRFTSEALRDNLEFAFRERGSIDEVRRRSTGSRPTNFSIQLDLDLGGQSAAYGYKIAAVAGGLFEVASEVCVVGAPERPVAKFEVRKGDVVSLSTGAVQPSASKDRLFLALVSGHENFRPVWETLTRMAFHNLSPELMKQPQKPQPGEQLSRDGRNFASFVKRLSDANPKALERTCGYLEAIGVPISQIEFKPIGGSYETVSFVQRSPKESKPWAFDATAMSDGTIRATGILLSLLSASTNGKRGPSLVGIEEPEAALHPAAAGALFDAIVEAAESTQIVVTCHSPELLDQDGVTADMIRVVVSEAGTTKVGSLSPAKKQLLQDHLATAGELHRLDQLSPDPAELAEQELKQNTLWGTSE